MRAPVGRLRAHETAISSVISAVDQLPALSGLMARLNDVVADPDVSVDEIVRLISLDQSLTARILKVVNSAHYGFQRQISTIRHALVILGFDEIRQIVLSTVVVDFFPPHDTRGLFDVWRFWEHSLGSAFLAKGIARILHYRVSGEVFVAGLLHDIGKMVLYQYLPEHFSRIAAQIIERHVPPIEAEAAVLGVTHGDLGYLLADHWNLPISISDAVHGHHDPARESRNPLMTAIIHLADVLAIRNGLATGSPWIREPTIDPRAWDTIKQKKLDLNETDLERFSLELTRCREQIDEFLQRPA